jgi:DNA polymerase III epsilon subunit family exonuclease
VPRTYIALDLETTGLDAARDAIIEVGAVKYRDGESIDRFSTLINPGRSIPYDITLITGITDRDVIGMPAFGEIAGTLTHFVGSLPVVGHNVGFDLGFLRGQGLLFQNIGLDSWELASILLPGLPSYSLGALTRRFGLPHASQHRALDDAQATGLLFTTLCEEAARLPHPVLLEINRLARDSDWPLAEVFADALAANRIAATPTRELSLEQIAPGSPLFQPLRSFDPLEPRDETAPIDTADLAAFLEPGGVLSRSFPGYEYRPPQVDMLKAVAGAFNQSHHMMAEAGTGIGKSLAYLLPAIAFAVKNGTRVVVSTNTINLQDQLFRKDLPDLQRILSQAWGTETPFRAALLKGRSNYLCPRRFAALKSRPSLSNEELRGIARILVWLPRTQAGEQGELSLPTAADRQVWSQVAADSAGCSLDRCQREMKGQCFFYRARKLAEGAHILVVNHALLMADAATENRVLPAYRQLILDEAHHLENAVTDQLSFRADTFLVNQLFATLSPRGGAEGARRAGRERGGQGGDGLLAEVAASLRSSRLSGEQLRPAFDLIVRLQADVQAAQTRLDSFWEVMEEVLQSLQPQRNNSEYDVRLRITDAVRSQSYWVEVEIAWENLAILWMGLLDRLEKLSSGLSELVEAGFDAKGLEGLAEELGITCRSLAELHEQMEAWCLKPTANQVYWAEASSEERRTRRIVLRAAPLHIGPLVQEHIFFENDTVILTSATLRTAGSFDYLRDRLSAEDADTVTVGSPFDYRESTLLYLPTDLPEPTASGYQTAVEQALISLARALGGRTLALFTSYAQLRRTVQAIVPALTEAGVMVLSQGTGGSRHQLLETFRNSEQTILMGTRSFWEGVDVVGPALSALALVRLPFAVPNDPIVAARAETFDDPFYQYSVPDAILRFRQGFGRLIRSKTDRGVVVILDKRVQSKSYGRLFLDSLPECTVRKLPLMNLPAEAQRWIERSAEN